MDRLFIDSNVLFSAAYSPLSQFRRLWSLPDVRILGSLYVINEVERRLVGQERQDDLSRLVAGMLITETVGGLFLPPGVVLPEKDRPILLAAVACQATHLLTGDKQHFGPLWGRRIAGVLVQRPADYLLAHGLIP